MSQKKIIGAVEIGTSKVVVLVGEILGRDGLNIIGMAQTTSMGVKKGEVTNLKSASDSTHAAIVAAEKSAGVSIDSIYLSCSGRHLDGFSTTGKVAVSSSDNVINRADLQRVGEMARTKALPLQRVYIHHILGGYKVDGQITKNPLGMTGEQLEVQYWNVNADERKISDQLHIINGFGIKVDDMIISSIASGCVVASEEEREKGVLVLDIGCGTTDFAVYKDGMILRTGVIGIGGDHITNDLAIGLRINYKNAESIKHRFGKAIVDTADKNDTVLLFGDLTIGDAPISRSSIYKITHARVEELFNIIHNKLGSLISAQNLPGGIIITGGSARLPHLCEAARQAFNVSARVAQNPAWVTNPELKAPDYSTVIGLLQYAMTGQRPDSGNRKKKNTGWFGKMTGIFAGN